MVLMVIPTPFLRRFIQANREKFPENVPLVCCSKGIEKVRYVASRSIKSSELLVASEIYLCPAFLQESMLDIFSFSLYSLHLVCSRLQDTLDTPYEIVRDELPGKFGKYLACISGPSFAKEVALDQPTNVTCAAVDQTVAEFVQKAMSDKLFRVYLGSDIIGCEIAGMQSSSFSVRDTLRCRTLSSG